MAHQQQHHNFSQPQPRQQQQRYGQAHQHQHYDQGHQQQYYDQGHAQQGQHQQYAGYDNQHDQQYYDQQYYDHGYDQGYGQGGYESWDGGYYDQQGRWVQPQQQGAYEQHSGHANQPPQAQAQRRRPPPQEQYAQAGAPDPTPERHHQPQQQPPPAPRPDPRSRPSGRGSGPPPNAATARGGLRPAGLDRSLFNPVAPKNVPLDNPFPTFPTKKTQPSPKRSSLEQNMSRMNIRDAQGVKGSPPLGQQHKNGVPPQPQSQQPRPDSNGRSDSGQFEGSRAQQRPPLGRGPPGQRPPPSRAGNSSGPAPRRPSDSRPPPTRAENFSGPAPRRPSDPRPSQPQMFGSGTQRSVTMPQTSEQERGYGSQEQWVEPGAAPGYYDVSSPTYAPPRPSTAGGNIQNTSQAQVLPQIPHRPQQQHTTQNHSLPPHEDVDDFYDDYYGESEPQRPLTSVMDMPDFDAIPQSNNKHRRGDSIENHLSPAAQPGPSYGLTQPISATDTHPTQFDAQYQAPQSYTQPDLHASNVYEMPGDAPPLPAVPRANTGLSNQHGLPNGQRGRGAPSRGMTTDGAYRGPPTQAYGQGQPPNAGALYSRQPPPVQRGYSGESTFSEPPPNTMRNGPSPMNPGVAIPRPGTAGPVPQRIPSDPMGRRPGTSQSHSNPDALPAHPAPFRPGLMQPGQQQQQQQQPQAQPAQVPRPPPVRQYNSDTTRPSSDSQQSGSQRQSAGLHPVTHDELNRLRNTWKSNPSDNATGLLFAKKLIEAASVLSDEGGTADTRTRNKNREKFILEGHKTIKKLIAAGYGEAMFYLADCYGQGLLGLQVDTKQAFLLYQSGAKAGHPASAYRTAVCCEMGHEEGGGTKREPDKAVQWYRRAAALGDTPALYKMGMILLKGLLGQQRNFGEAINMLKRAAERADRDNPHALHELALIYEAQTGNDRVIVDEAYSLQLFHQAADLNYKFSQFRLGQAYEYGLLGCPIDARTSIAWYTRAAAQEEHQSELALSGWYLTGTQGMLEQSDTEAYLWARKAACAEPPLPKALFAMGYFTEVGIGCPRSLDEAKRWYGRAAAYKFPKAQERLEELKRGGSKAQMKRERLSRTNQKQQEENCTVM